MDNYETLNVLGEGAYGIVIKCRDKRNGDIVAIKKFKDVDVNDDVRKTVMREVKILSAVSHENIVGIRETFRRKGRLYIVFEFMERNILQLIESSEEPIPPDTTRRFLYELLLALEACHSKKILHRDIKPENLLVKTRHASSKSLLYSIDMTNLVLKLCDFGFARYLPGHSGAHGLDPADMTPYVSTRWYRAPELLLSQSRYGPEVDIWSAGCIFAELAEGKPLFPGDSDIDQLYLIQTALGSMCEKHHEAFRQCGRFGGMKLPSPSGPPNVRARLEGLLGKMGVDLLVKMLAMDPTQRSSASDCLKHAYFRGMESGGGGGGGGGGVVGGHQSSSSPTPMATASAKILTTTAPAAAATTKPSLKPQRDDDLEQLLASSDEEDEVVVVKKSAVAAAAAAVATTKPSSIPPSQPAPAPVPPPAPAPTTAKPTTPTTTTKPSTTTTTTTTTPPGKKLPTTSSALKSSSAAAAKAIASASVPPPPPSGPARRAALVSSTTTSTTTSSTLQAPITAPTTQASKGILSYVDKSDAVDEQVRAMLKPKAPAVKKKKDSDDSDFDDDDDDEGGGGGGSKPPTRPPPIASRPPPRTTTTTTTTTTTASKRPGIPPPTTTTTKSYVPVVTEEKITGVAKETTTAVVSAAAKVVAARAGALSLHDAPHQGGGGGGGGGDGAGGSAAYQGRRVAAAPGGGDAPALVRPGAAKAPLPSLEALSDEEGGEYEYGDLSELIEEIDEEIEAAPLTNNKNNNPHASTKSHVVAAKLVLPAAGFRFGAASHGMTADEEEVEEEEDIRTHAPRVHDASYEDDFE